MNERMNALATEAFEFAYKVCKEEGRKGGSEDHIWTTLAMGKLSELIIQECAKICNSNSWQDQQGWGKYYAKQIYEYFGVK